MDRCLQVTVYEFLLNFIYGQYQTDVTTSRNLLAVIGFETIYELSGT